MKKPTKEELYNRINALESENYRLKEEKEAEARRVWEARKPAAVAEFWRKMAEIFGNLVINAAFEHVDQSGYWFSFELENDARRQSYVVRHTDF